MGELRIVEPLGGIVVCKKQRWSRLPAAYPLRAVKVRGDLSVLWAVLGGGFLFGARVQNLVQRGLGTKRIGFSTGRILNSPIWRRSTGSHLRWR